MSKIQCYECKGYGHFKKDCPKLKKGNKKRKRNEAHVTEDVEEPDEKKSKKEEVIVDSNIDINILTCQVKMLLDNDILKLMPS